MKLLRCARPVPVRASITIQNRNSGEPMAEEKKLSGPDFAEGVSITEFADGGMMQGHANGEAILVARRGDAYFAIGASCTHYGGPLAEGLIVGDTVRCPWHHACFSLRTGEALRAPALDPVSSLEG